MQWVPLGQSLQLDPEPRFHLCLHVHRWVPFETLHEILQLLACLQIQSLLHFPWVLGLQRVQSVQSVP